MKGLDHFQFRVELWAEGNLFCYTNIHCPSGLDYDSAFDHALEETLKNGGNGFLIRIFEIKTAQSALPAKKNFHT